MPFRALLFLTALATAGVAPHAQPASEGISDTTIAIGVEGPVGSL